MISKESGNMVQKFLIILILLLSSIQTPTWARKKSNVFNSTISDVELKIAGKSGEQIVAAVFDVLKGREKWLDSFMKQNPRKLDGVFIYDDKINVMGIAYSTNSSKARAEADNLCLRAMEDNDIEQVGVYSKYLKISTKNGYFIYAIKRSPVSSGFRSVDFSTGNNEVDELFK